jgi:1-acyl-sn-glycerol-3-phosphate acyltransferase
LFNSFSKIIIHRLFYRFTRFLIRLALPLFLRRLSVCNRAAVPKRGPVLLASTHPDSFFDAVVIGSVLSQPMHTLTRGDVFRKPAVAYWLRLIQLIPVFRGSEGRQYLVGNAGTFRESLRVLEAGEAVLIFSEGVCVNEWRLRPLGKGTARLAYQAWYGPAPLPDLPVVPVGLTYEHFRGAGKWVAVEFGEPLRANQLLTPPTDYEKWLREFNDLLTQRLQQAIRDVPSPPPSAAFAEDHRLPQQRLPQHRLPQHRLPQHRLPQHRLPQHRLPQQGTFPGRLAGRLGRFLHRPLYRYLSALVATRTAGTVFYDSVLFGLLLYGYPLLVLVMALAVALLLGTWWGVGLFGMLPLLAKVGNRYR